MKILFIIAIIFFLNCSCMVSKSRQIQRAYVKHLAILDSASQSNLSDTVSCCAASIAFMVEHTNVQVEATPGFHGFLYFRKQELKRWHKFYDSAYVVVHKDQETGSSGKND
jgi:hypothetical protein